MAIRIVKFTHIQKSMQCSPDLYHLKVLVLETFMEKSFAFSK